MVWIQTNPSRLKFTSLKIFWHDYETCVRLTTSILASPGRITSFYNLWKHLCGCVTAECESWEWSFLSCRSIRSWSPSFLQSADPDIFWCGRMSWLNILCLVQSFEKSWKQAGEACPDVLSWSCLVIHPPIHEADSSPSSLVSVSASVNISSGKVVRFRKLVSITCLLC